MATMGDAQLTVSQLQVYYRLEGNNFPNMLYNYGMDATYCSGTWAAAAFLDNSHPMGYHHIRSCSLSKFYLRRPQYGGI